jgi:hypothetical protein
MFIRSAGMQIIPQKGGCAALFRPPLTPSLIYATVGVEHELVLVTDSAPVRRCSVKPFQLGQTV